MLPIILASESPSRLNLLSRIKIIPDQIIPASIDETNLKGEKPDFLSKRLASGKADKVASQVSSGYIIAADTVSCVSRTIMPKADTEDLVRYCLTKISGRRSRIYTSVCVIKKTETETIKRLKTVCTMLKFKRLTQDEIEYYINSKEGLNKAGGYAVEGIAGSFLELINGSYSNIVGLPLLETRNMLLSVGFKF
jgi:septum formation protein